MSQEELGRRVGVTKGAVSAWESGATELSMRRANDVARALDMNIIQLMHGITSTATDSTQIDGGSIVPRVRVNYRRLQATVIHKNRRSDDRARVT